MDSFGLYWTILGSGYGEKTVLEYPQISGKNCLLSFVLSCIFNFDQFKGHFKLFGFVSGYFEVGVGSELFWSLF